MARHVIIFDEENQDDMYQLELYLKASKMLNNLTEIITRLKYDLKHNDKVYEMTADVYIEELLNFIYEETEDIKELL